MEDGKSNENGGLDQVKRSKHRSPNYPAVGLQKALERTETLKKSAGRHAVPVNVAHKLWDYRKGAGDQTVAALKAFGLVDVEGAKDKRQILLTDAAIRMLGNAPDKAELLKTAALKPEIHKQIWTKYGGELPSENAILKEYLLWERKFNEAFVDSFIEQFRSTIAFAGLALSDKLAAEDQSDLESEEEPMSAVPRTSVEPRRRIGGTRASSQLFTNTGSARELRFSISRDSEAQVIFHGPVTQEAIDKLSKLLELQKDTFPTREEFERAETQPQSDPPALSLDDAD